LWWERIPADLNDLGYVRFDRRTQKLAGRAQLHDPRSDTRVTPSASEIRKKAASEASSLSSVVRATRPASSATANPAINPPAVMADRLSPAIRKPAAAPGRIACDMASPIRLMRRSMRKTPTGPAPSASAHVPTRARRMNSKSAKGAMRDA